MFTITVRNVHAALPRGIFELLSVGIPAASRAGEVLVHPGPVATVYERPWERVMFWAQRDANPFFHLMEGLWMLAGRRDVAWLCQFNARMATYAQGQTNFHGAYGYRWRKAWGRDQLEAIVQLLHETPNSRRAVLCMWNPRTDLYSSEAEGPVDVPCNNLVYFTVQGGYLSMTVVCRSNDIIWGAYGANAVHFSMLQEYVAGRLKLDMGSMTQFSNNYHAYRATLDPLRRLAETPVTVATFYDHGHATWMPMMQEPDLFMQDLALFFEAPDSNAFANPFFARIIKLMYWAHKAWQRKNDPERYTKALDILKQMPANNDWRIAAEEWVQRREVAARSKEHADV